MGKLDQLKNALRRKEEVKGSLPASTNNPQVTSEILDIYLHLALFLIDYCFMQTLLENLHRKKSFCSETEFIMLQKHFRQTIGKIIFLQWTRRTGLDSLI